MAGAPGTSRGGGGGRGGNRKHSGRGSRQQPHWGTPRSHRQPEWRRVRWGEALVEVAGRLMGVNVFMKGRVQAKAT